MNVTIKNQPTSMAVSTVTLQPEEGNNMYAFHCTNCGNYLQQIGGKVSKIYPFYEPSNDVPVIIRCTSCKQKYTFQTHDGYNSEKVRVLLHPTEDYNEFYCWDGKHQILEFNEKRVITIPDNKPHYLPLFTRCKGVTNGVRCTKEYYFAEIL